MSKAPADALFKHWMARCSSRRPFLPASASTRSTGRSRSNSTATWARCCGSTGTDRSRRTTRLWAVPARIRRSTRLVSGHPGCNNPSPHRQTVDERTRPRGGDEINAVDKGKNYGFPVIGYGRDIQGNRSTATRPRRKGWSSRCISGRPTSRRRASASTPRSCFLPGRATCSCPTSSAVSRSSRDQRRAGDREERLLTELNARIRGVTKGRKEHSMS